MQGQISRLQDQVSNRSMTSAVLAATYTLDLEAAKKKDVMVPSRNAAAVFGKK